MSNQDIIQNITFHETGPWDIPEQITQKISWLTDIDRQGGKAIFNIGYHLLKGTGGYQKDPNLAYEWIYISSEIYDYAPAHYMRAMLLRSQEYYDLRRKFTIDSLDHKIFSDVFHTKLISSNLLLKAAMAGDIRADKEILTLYKKIPDYDNENSEIYFWMMKISQKDKSIFSENDLALARKKLLKYDQDSVNEKIRQNHFPESITELISAPRHSIPLDSL